MCLITACIGIGIPISKDLLKIPKLKVRDTMSFCGVKKIAKLNSKNLGTRIKDIKINEELHLFLVMDQLGLQKHHIYCNANKQRIICFNSWSEDPITFDKLLFTKVY